MKRYTYTLHRGKNEEPKNSYRRSDLKKMTLFRLREICRKEKLVVPSGMTGDREGLIRLIMRFRGRREYRQVRTGCEGGLERLELFFKSNEIHLSDGQEVRIPGTIMLYRDTGMNELDGYRVQSEGELYGGNLLLIDEHFHVYTCFYLEEVAGEYYLFKGGDVPVRPLEKHLYSMLYFPDGRDSEFICDCYYGERTTVPGYIEGIRIPLLEIREEEIAESALPLVIDFGSSNTTMGICLADGTMRAARAGGKALIPSVVGVRAGGNGEAELVFGHEAEELAANGYPDEDVTVFYDIKRWVSNPDRAESVILENGCRYRFLRREMLRAYLDYLIGLARQQFKCSFSDIQMLAPIRQKEKFKELFTQLLPEYSVGCELDEGMAVLFDSIQRMIRQDAYEAGRWYHALIIDCGGGTTDLTSGRFRIENNRVSYIIGLETRYENGDTNFGGNNLTYRLMQLLKVRIAEAAGVFPARELQGLPDRWYPKAESVLPTRFKDYEEKSREQYFFVKNNYYYLFGLAEQVKQKLFQPAFLQELCISTKEEDGEGILLDRWRLSVVRNGEFAQIDGPIRFSLCRNEIEEALRPDIYRVMEHFLGQKFEEGALQKYEMIKLTGQSCKSGLFTEALREYVPGKLIAETKADKERTELKMCCLNGALSYFFNCKLGYMKVNQDYQVGSLPYEIMAFTHENKEKILIESLDTSDHIGCISRFCIGRQLDLYLNDAQGRRLKTYYFEYDASKFARTTQEEIDREYRNTVIQEETDIIQEGEMKFFVWVSRKRWGFVVLPVLREGELLYRGEETFFDFEDDTWELNFFDGRK